jgi:hypothetical protein
MFARRQGSAFALGVAAWATVILPESGFSPFLSLYSFLDANVGFPEHR